MNIQELRELAEEFFDCEFIDPTSRDALMLRNFLDGVSSGKLARHRSERAIRWFKATGRLTGELRT